MNLVESIAVASFGAGAAGTAGVLLGGSGPSVALAAVCGAAASVAVFARAVEAPTLGAKRAAAVFVVLGFLSVVGFVAPLRLPAQGSGRLLAWELAKVAGLMLAGGLGVTAAFFGLLAGVRALPSRRRDAGGEPGA